MSLTQETVISWTVEVNPAQLGAHLQAYAESLPMIYALRAANRFGKDAPITKLPSELIGIIEGHFLKRTRTKYLRSWQFRAFCALQTFPDFDDKNHLKRLDTKHLHKIVSKFGKTDCPHCDRYARCEACIALLKRKGNNSICCDDYGDLLSEFLDESDDLLNLHTEHRENWRAGVKTGTLFRDTSQDLLKTVFGLEVWMTLERSTDTDAHDPCEFTRAYIIPAGTRKYSAACMLSSIDVDFGLLDPKTQVSEPLTLPTVLDDHERARFFRVVNALGLDPVNGPSTYGAKVDCNGVKKAYTSRKISKWPVLTIMSRASFYDVR